MYIDDYSSIETPSFEAKIEFARQKVQELLVPPDDDFDELKIEQLRQLKQLRQLDLPPQHVGVPAAVQAHAARQIHREETLEERRASYTALPSRPFR